MKGIIKTGIIIGALTLLGACSSKYVEIAERDTYANLNGMLIVPRQVLKAGSGGKKIMLMLVVQAKVFLYRLLKNKCMLLQ